ncbi:hypothetical protein AOQ88_01475 [Candidatus Riesia sp. GBBU]|nr:hypothetical protein AOQ88_01475 [Candidatus Riesia sp. GBBU]
MKLKRSKKKDLVQKIKKLIELSKSIAISNFSKVTANSFNDLRKTCRKELITIQIFPNSLMKIAFSKTQHKFLKKEFSGPIVVAFSQKVPKILISLLKEFSKKNPTFSIKSVSFENKLIKGNKISLLSNISTKKESICLFLSFLIETSVIRLIRIMFMIQILKSKSSR